jgi:molecular chaperone GrpE
MSEKKKIKVKVSNDEPETKESAEEVYLKDKQHCQNEVEKKDLVEVDDPIRNLEAQLQVKTEESKENYDRLLRVSAEFENYKKRSAREMEEHRKFANQALIKEMLSVVDNLELAMNSTDSAKAVDKGLLEGLKLTHQEILRVFEKFDVKPMNTKGQPFDPTFHEAVMQEETDDFAENAVVHELQKGYLIHERLLRPAMVVVAKPKNRQGSQAPEKDNDTI